MPFACARKLAYVDRSTDEEVGGKGEDAGALLLVETAFGLAMPFASILGVGKRAQLRVPVRLERVCDHAIVWIDVHIAPPRELDLILCILHLLATQAIGFVDARLELLLDGERLHVHGPGTPGQRGRGGAAHADRARDGGNAAALLDRRPG